MTFLERLLKNHLGFSITQAVLGLGIVAGLGLVVAQISKQASQGHKTTVSNYSVIELTAEIQSLLSKKEACFESLKSPTALLPNGTRAVSALVKEDGTPVFITGGDYSNNEIRIVNMTLQRREQNSLLAVTFRKNSAPVNIRKEFLINTEWLPNNILSGCASDISNYIETVVELAIAKACMSEGVLLSTDDPNAPTQCRALAQLGENPALLSCPIGQTYSGLVWDTSLNRYKMECKSLLVVNNCGPDQLLRRESDGEEGSIFKCVDVSCGKNAISTGMGANGVMGCIRCGDGETLVTTSSGPACVVLSCGDGEYLKSIQSNGQPLCVPLISPSENMCTDSAKIEVTSDGSLTVNCCTPNCTDAGTICEGLSYDSPNGCGRCIGTRAKDCSNASNYCSGTTNPSASGCGSCAGTKLADCSDAANYCTGTIYSSSNGCGGCTGSKPRVDGVGSWTATTETRNVGSCQSGIQKTEKKEIKICTIASCGGVPCIPEERWVPGPNKSCSSGGAYCTTVYRCHLGRISSGECLEGGVLGSVTAPTMSPSCDGREERVLEELCREICGGGP